MKIAFYVYPIAFQSPGGGEILLLKTKEYLEKEGIRVKLFDPWNDKLASFDILHTFGSVKDCLRVMQTAKTLGVKNVLSSVCWYSWKSAWGTYPAWGQRIPSVLRHLAKSAFPFLPSERRKMMQCSDRILPNSVSEAHQLERYFGVSPDKMTVIPNAVDSSFADAKPDLFREKYKLENFILCVGRIEPRKNQLGVIRALRGTPIPLVFIGDHIPAYKDYYETCRREAEEGVHFLGGLPHDSEMLRSAYAACNTFLLATWLETPGLAALEAGLAGAKVVITREGATREYFCDHAVYVAPEDARDIRKKTVEVFGRPKDSSLQQHILKNYLWPTAAKKNIDVYRSVLAHPGS